MFSWLSTSFVAFCDDVAGQGMTCFTTGELSVPGLASVEVHVTTMKHGEVMMPDAAALAHSLTPWSSAQ